MAAHRPARVLVPACGTLESRLAPSGNFLSHGVAEVSRDIRHEFNHEHHQGQHGATDHAKTGHDATTAPGMKVHYHHVNAGTTK